jgi:hypothetical protein
LDLSNTQVTDIGALGNVHTLDLSFAKVTDASIYPDYRGGPALPFWLKITRAKPPGR